MNLLPLKMQGDIMHRCNEIEWTHTSDNFSCHIQYQTVQYVKNQTAASTYIDVLGQVSWIYGARGFKNIKIHCDNKFLPLIEPLEQEFDVVINFANPREHVPEAQRNDWVIKQRVQALYHCLLYFHIFFAWPGFW